MKNILYKVLSIMAVMILFVSCEKTLIDKANDEYDWSKSVPKIYSMSGPTSFIASGLQSATYSVLIRGGSTYAWTVTKVDADVVVDPATPNKCSVTFAAQPADTAANVVVVETSALGKASDPYTTRVKLSRYCPVAMDSFTGAYTEDDGEGELADVTVARDAADALFGLKLSGILSESYWWGSPGGNLTFKIDGCTNTLNFSKQTTGIVDPTYGAVSMELNGGVKGWIKQSDFSFGYHGKVTVSAGSFGDYDFVYLKD